MTNITDLQVLSSMTCQHIDELLKDLNTSDYESRNMTREAFIDSLRKAFCIPKPYAGLEGVNKWIVTIILGIFLIFGLVGNILSATIMYRRARRGLSSYFYLALLALVDICVLYSSGLLFMLEITFDYHPQLQANIFCRLGFYIQHLFTYISAWLIVAVTFERFIVVRFPFQSIIICRMRVAHTVTLIIVLFFSLYTAHCFFTLKITDPFIQTDEGYHPDYSVCDLIIYKRLLAFIDLCFYSALPSFFIIIFNILIITTMFYAIKQRRNFLQASSYLPTTDGCPRNVNRKNKSSSSTRTPFFRSRSVESTPGGRSYALHGRTHHNGLNKTGTQQVLFDSTSATGIRLTCLLLIISFIFVLCTLPISIRFLIANFIPEYDRTIHWQISRISLTLLMYLNHTVNFVFYCLTGRAFRNECRKILRGIWALKDIHISCTINPHLDKPHHYHQQLMLTDRNRMINPPPPPQQQQQRMKRSYL